MANLKNNHRYSELNGMVYIFLHESDRIEFNARTGAVSVPWLMAMRVMSKYIFPAPKLTGPGHDFTNDIILDYENSVEMTGKMVFIP